MMDEPPKIEQNTAGKAGGFDRRRRQDRGRKDRFDDADRGHCPAPFPARPGDTPRVQREALSVAQVSAAAVVLLLEVERFAETNTSGARVRALLRSLGLVFGRRPLQRHSTYSLPISGSARC